MSHAARRHLLQVAAAATVTLLVTACTVGPDYTRPPVAAPSAYATPTTTATPAVPTPWWSIYHDRELDALVARVAVDNQSLKAAAARMRQAQALLAATRGEQVPSVGIGTFNVGRSNRRDFGIGASWEIDLWGRIRRAVQAQGAAATASADDLAAATLSMQAQFVQSYFALREKDAQITALQPLVAADARWVKMLANQLAQGVASNQDVAAAQARLADARGRLANARIARSQLEHALAVMLGRPPEEFSLAPAPFTTEVPTIPAGVPSTLLQRRPDIAAAERRMAAASAQIGVRVAEQYPQLNLVAGFGVRHGAFATPSVKAPIYAGGTLHANVAHARAAYDEAVANYRQTVLDAFREVEDELTAQNVLAEAAVTQDAATRSARAAARMVDNQYHQGVVGYQAVVEAHARAVDGVAAAAQLRLQRLDASVNLVAATGGGWAADADAPAQPAASDGGDLHQTGSRGNATHP